jgi:hypothetical protein
MATRLAALQPEGRVFASGGLRFRLNSWYPLHQVGGTFETGLRNRVPLGLAYQLRTLIGSEAGKENRDTIVQLKALGAQYIAVHGPGSAEHYRDVRDPVRLEGMLERVFHNGYDAIYRVPFESYARLAWPRELPENLPGAGYHAWLEQFQTATEAPERPRLKTRWVSPRALEIEGPMPAGMVASLIVNYDPGWVAVQDGSPVRVVADNWGFTVLHPKPSPHSTVRLFYRGTNEQRAMAVLSAAAWIAAIGLLIINRK